MLGRTRLLQKPAAAAAASRPHRVATHVCRFRHSSTTAAPVSENPVDSSTEGDGEPTTAGGKARFSPQVTFGKNKIGWIALPDEMIGAIEAEISTASNRQLKRDVARIHASLRSTGSASKLIKYATPTARVPLIAPHTIQYGPLETQAYLASRTVPGYAAAWNVLTQVARRCPDFKPTTCLDFGTGPGTALWAANGVWTGIETNVGIDLSEPMLAAATRLAAGSNSRIRGFSTRRFVPLDDSTPPSDLVIASFVLEDLPSDAVRTATIATLWGRTADTLVLIDRGTPEGFARIAAARAEILATENAKNATPEDSDTRPPESLSKAQSRAAHAVHIVAPCPHSLTCPMLSQSSWCHFSQRIQRSKHMMATSPDPVSKNHQDIKFAYVVLRRGPASRASTAPFVDDAFSWPRVIAPPMKRDKHVVLDYCGRSGRLERTIVSKGKAGKSIYYEARKSAWGDIWPHPPFGTVVVKEDKATENDA
ncbi:Methyltransferase-like protein 17, mitochondrial [Geranomyces variabilis]|nr:Methyltransferase-like protein 17, mitochondrial [Geranomyces variabilis]